MEQEDELAALQDRAAALEKAVSDLDHDMIRTWHAVAEGKDVGHFMLVLRDQQNSQLDLARELGKLDVQIADRELRLQERAERGLEHKRADQWQQRPPSEDHLDWLRPVLDAPAVRDDRAEQRVRAHEAQDRMLDEMEREDRTPEDYLDWCKR